MFVEFYLSAAVLENVNDEELGDIRRTVLANSVEEEMQDLSVDWEEGHQVVGIWTYMKYVLYLCFQEVGDQSW